MAKLVSTLFYGAILQMNRRNAFDITKDILQVCIHGANQTHIVYSANLNDVRAKRYLGLCVDMNLLKKELNSNHGNSIYRTTVEGRHFLQDYCIWQGSDRAPLKNEAFSK